MKDRGIRLSQFSQEGQRRLHGVLREISRRSGRKDLVSLNELVAGWEHFVRSVEAGYDDCIYEYTNDLSIRGLLESVIQKLDSESRTQLVAAIDSLDQRFRSATNQSVRPVAPGVVPEDGWWWYRIPNKLPDEIAEDLRSEGLLE
jgi:hypothetical protein